MITTTELINISITPTRVYSYLSAGVQPRQDPGGTLRMNGIGKREREREIVTRRGVQQSLAESGNPLFFTIAFIP